MPFLLPGAFFSASLSWTPSCLGPQAYYHINLPKQVLGLVAIPETLRVPQSTFISPNILSAGSMEFFDPGFQENKTPVIFP